MALFVVPEWVSPPHRAVSDLYWLTFSALSEDRTNAYAGGIESVLWWIGGNEASPVTAREGQPVPRTLADSEFRAAGAMLDTTGALWSVIAAELGSDTWVPPLMPEQWANGVYRTVSWLLTGTVMNAPLEVPLRLPDGSTPTAEDLYAVAVAAEPWKFDLPEQRDALRVRSEVEAARYHRLAVLVGQVWRQQTGGGGLLPH